jgi:hypothetical protein
LLVMVLNLPLFFLVYLIFLSLGDLGMKKAEYGG